MKSYKSLNQDPWNFDRKSETILDSQLTSYNNHIALSKFQPKSHGDNVYLHFLIKKKKCLLNQ